DNATDAEHTLSVFQTFAVVLRSAPVYPAFGNHETGSSDAPTQTGPYFDAFTLPTAAEAGGVASGTEAHYSFDYGNVHFVILASADSDRSVGGDMYLWLEADLMANTKDWLIAAWHHPPYTKGSHNSDSGTNEIQMRENFIPLLEDFGVDLVLAGHSHAYERSMLIDGHYGSSSTLSGAHIVDGASGDPNGSGAYLKPSGSVPHMGGIFAVVGSSSRLSGVGNLDHPVMVRNFREFGSGIIDIAGNTLNMRFLDDADQVLDEFEVVKEIACDDGIDNDGDGLIDLLDPGCVDSSDLSEDDTAVALPMDSLPLRLVLVVALLGSGMMLRRVRSARRP
ncbi:MAG: metallophosphoesterase, partial [Myxococcota bacterium]